MSINHKKRTVVQKPVVNHPKTTGTEQNPKKIEDSEKVKAAIYSLKEKITEKLLSNPEMVKKASQIISFWINKK